MFVGGQNFSCLWGHNSVGSVIWMILININLIIVYTFVGM